MERGPEGQRLLVPHSKSSATSQTTVAVIATVQGFSPFTLVPETASHDFECQASIKHPALVAAGASLPPGLSALQPMAVPALSVSAGLFERADERASNLATWQELLETLQRDSHWALFLGFLTVESGRAARVWAAHRASHGRPFGRVGSAMPCRVRSSRRPRSHRRRTPLLSGR